jgi:hypothetical protein
MYDSRPDTEKHIARVQELLGYCIHEFRHRADVHDLSKLEDPEKSTFDEFTPKLAASTYGSAEYKEMLSGLKPALDHHYQENSHHPEHYINGVNDMNLFDILEMLMDWKAATERHDNGSIDKSIRINQSRFGINEQLVIILENTIKYMNLNG